MLLSAFLNCFCDRRWQAFEGARLPIQAPKYSFFQSSLSTRSDSRALAADLLLIFYYGPCCLKYYQPHILHCCQLQTQNSAVYHSLAFSLWYLVPVGIRERRRESFIFWAIQACKFICLLDVTLEKDQETWLPTCNSAWFWGTCYSARLCRLEYSFVA